MLLLPLLEPISAPRVLGGISYMHLIRSLLCCLMCTAHFIHLATCKQSFDSSFHKSPCGLVIDEVKSGIGKKMSDLSFVFIWIPASLLAQRQETKSQDQILYRCSLCSDKWPQLFCHPGLRSTLLQCAEIDRNILQMSYKQARCDSVPAFTLCIIWNLLEYMMKS